MISAQPKPRPRQKAARALLKRSRPRKRRKTSLGAAKRTLWDYFARYVKERDGKRCFTCGAAVEGVNLHAGHMFSRRIGSTIYDPKNCHSQCAGCNKWLKGNTAVYVAKFLDMYGEAEFRRLVQKTRETRRWKLPEILELTEALKHGGANFELFYAERYGF